MKQNLQTAVIGALGGMLVMAIMAQAPMAIRSDGIQFTDGTVLTSADTRRSFYLTNSSSVGGNGLTAPDACADGYHMASLYEILDVTQLRYANEHPDARQSEDGEGPTTGISGWVRTGAGPWGLPPSSADPQALAGRLNCESYASNTSGHYGTKAVLNNCWGKESDCGGTHSLARWWNVSSSLCQYYGAVWCVSD